jgi:hypothetical protein
MKKLGGSALCLQSGDVVVIGTHTEPTEDHDSSYGKVSDEEVYSYVRIINIDGTSATLTCDGTDEGIADLETVVANISNAISLMKLFKENTDGKDQTQEAGTG